MNHTLLLDSEALSRLLRDERAMTARIAAARRADAAVCTSAMTVVEAAGPRIHPSRVSFVLSRLRVEPVLPEDGRWAHTVLTRAGLHGHKYAIAAVLAALAVRLSHGNVTLLTSDPEDLTVLLGDGVGARVRVVGL
ncbi:hypothetical protein BIV57_15975 [Mangrovactinospora gilvigrisea]|uniref:DNA-binding protein n=1 Tax=Mangrovactinospora gilvigrisea TaxID=1428644 RepID=A0A1J7BSR1_9ACTN|nr:hypothetical protein [Mangrovactinospora gilvigrisea]OIV36497.1 hypothetical protein BIV57_15975 [Mangrovactinospora gilvigrisea]